MNEFDFLEEQGVAEGLIQAAADYRKEYGVSEEEKCAGRESGIYFRTSGV